MRELKITRKKDTDKKEEKIPKSTDGVASGSPLKSGKPKAYDSSSPFGAIAGEVQVEEKGGARRANLLGQAGVGAKPRTLKEKNDGIKSFLDKRYNKK